MRYIVSPYFRDRYLVGSDRKSEKDHLVISRYRGKYSDIQRFFFIVDIAKILYSAHSDVEIKVVYREVSGVGWVQLLGWNMGYWYF